MMQWPADSVERMPVATLLPYIRNTRKHPPAQVDQIARSMREWGFTIPMLIDENLEIIAGHGRLLAAKKLGYESVPVMTARGWTPEQIKAYRIADNQLALTASWDAELLALELTDLSEEMRILTGLAEGEIERLLAASKGGLTDPDAAPEVPAVPTAKLGDLWLCGTHRILCGDATKAEDVTRLFDGALPTLMVTDPPYGVNYDPAWRNEASRADSLGRAIGAKAVGKVSNDHRDDWTEAWALFPGSVAYVWHGSLHTGVVAASLIASGFAMRAAIIWSKNNFAIGRGDYHWQHEPCWYAVKVGGKSGWRGDRTQSTVWEIPKNQASETGHSTQKPVECMRRPILNNSAPGDAVYDPFVGSGTTLIAAEMEARQAFCMEIDPAYIDVAVQRWEAFTGLKATLERAKAAA